MAELWCPKGHKKERNVMMEFCDKCPDSCECYYHGCQKERLGGGGSEPTTGPRNAEREVASEEVKSGGEAVTRATAHVHGRRDDTLADRMAHSNFSVNGKPLPSFWPRPGERSDLNDEPPKTGDERCPECDGDGEEAFYNADIDETCYGDCWSCLGTGKRKSNPHRPETEAERSVDSRC